MSDSLYPGGSSEPPSFSAPDPTPVDTWKVCAALEYDERLNGKPRIEETLGPAEVEYVNMSAKSYTAMQERIARLTRDLQEARREIDNEKMLRDAVMVVSARKDRDYYVMCGIAVLLGVALIGLLVVMAWRLA